MNKIDHWHQPVLEIAHKAEKPLDRIDHRLSQADVGRVGLHAVAGGRAFRNYSVLKDVAITNSSGNFRGMVLSGKWRVIFRNTADLPTFEDPSELAKSGGNISSYLQNVGLFAGFAAEVVKATPQIDNILSYDESLALRGARLTAIAGTAAQRALLGAVPAGVHLIYRSLEGWCMLAGLAGGSLKSAAEQCIDTLHRADRYVATSFEYLTDTQNQSKAVWIVVDSHIRLLGKIKKIRDNTLNKTAPSQHLP